MFWNAFAGGLRCGAICISFQRFLEKEPVFERAPASLGALPVAVINEGFGFPLHQGESFWIGIDGTEAQKRSVVALTAVRKTGAFVPLIELTVPAFAVVPGIPHSGGRVESFAAARLQELTIGLNADPPVIVRPLAVDAFERATGQRSPGPADPGAGYRGWRLP